MKANASLESSLERKVPELSVKEFADKAYEENKEDDEEENDKDRHTGRMERIKVTANTASEGQ